MDKPYQPPSILRLHGIELKDWTPLEDISDQRLLESTTADDPLQDAEIPPDRIPRIFTGLKGWPHRTNLPCWQCDCTFDDRPKFVSPYIRESESLGVESGVIGNMCTFNCAQLWIDIMYAGKEEQRRRISDNNCMIYFIFTGVRVARIQPAYPKTERRKYGGTWDEDTFWKKMRELDPVAGLRNHTPGSIIPERNRVVSEELRVRSAVADLRARSGITAAPVPRVLSDAPDTETHVPGGPMYVSSNSAWSVCGLVIRGEDDSVSIRTGAPTAAVRAADGQGAAGRQADDVLDDEYLARFLASGGVYELADSDDLAALLAAVDAPGEPVGAPVRAPEAMIAVAENDPAPPSSAGAELDELLDELTMAATGGPPATSAARGPDAAPAAAAAAALTITDADIDTLFAAYGL
jgi:hypothetical protein